MKCASCGDVPIGLLNGEPVCEGCATMASFAEAAVPLVVFTTFEDLAARLRRLHRDEDFYRRAKRAQQSGGCRQ